MLWTHFLNEMFHFPPLYYLHGYDNGGPNFTLDWGWSNPCTADNSTEKWNTIAIFPPTMMRKEINMEGWRICSGKKKYVRAISWEEGRNNFGHVYALTAIDWLLSNKTIIDGKIIIFMCYQAGCLSINVWWNHYIFSSQLYQTLDRSRGGHRHGTYGKWICCCITLIIRIQDSMDSNWLGTSTEDCHHPWKELDSWATTNSVW